MADLSAGLVALVPGRPGTPRRAQGPVPGDVGVGTVGQPQRVTGDDGRLHHAGRAGIGARACGHRWRQSAADVGGDPPSRRGPPLPGGVRQPHRSARSISGAAGGWLRVPSGSCCMPAIAAVPGRAARSRPITARPTSDDGWAAADSPTDIDKLVAGLRARQPAHRRNRLDHPKTQRRPHRMDPTTPARHRPSPRQQLPPPRALSHPRR